MYSTPKILGGGGGGGGGGRGDSRLEGRGGDPRASLPLYETLIGMYGGTYVITFSSAGTPLCKGGGVRPQPFFKVGSIWKVGGVKYLGYSNGTKLLIWLLFSFLF